MVGSELRAALCELDDNRFRSTLIEKG